MEGQICRKLFLALLVVLSTLSAPLTSQARSDDDDPELMGYESIIQNLNRESNGPPPGSSRLQAQPSNRHPLDSIWIHGGAGMTMVMQELRFDDGSLVYFGGRGVQASLGIDLFSENWMAEGTVRSFGENDDQAARISLKEFELKLFYKNRLSRQLGIRGGTGLSARYLTVRRLNQGVVEYSTPTAVGTMGMDFFLNDRFSIGLDISARSAMIPETVDRTAYDGTIRLDAHF